MTITYTGDVASARLCAFSRLLLRWKGSIYKLLYKEMCIFCSLYALLSVIYRVGLRDDHKRVFERVVLYCEMFINLIPLSFVLGFYVAIVIGRWWNQYTHIPWPDRVMLYVSTMIDGADEQGRLIRRTLMRYLTLGSLIVFQATSVRIKKRFPTMEHLIEAGIVTRSEVQALDEINTPHGKWWIPFVWCGSILKAARKQGLIQDNYLFKSLIDEISEYRGNLGMLYAYDWISIPLVYTQVTTLAVYTFFLGCTFGRQFLDPAQNYPGHSIDLYFPFFTFLQFFFYMGWLKVAEQLINPFGEDDDDFEMNWIIDRNMQVSLLVADDMCGQFPPLEKDMYFGEPPPDYLPYTKSSVKSMSLPHMGSTADIRISDEGMKVLTVLETIQEGVALQCPSHLPSYLSSTPLRVSTPPATPMPIRYQNQNMMSGMRSPDVISRMSHVSLQSCRDSELGSSSTDRRQFHAGSNIFTRAGEKLGNWLINRNNSQMGSNPTINIHGGTSFSGLGSRKSSGALEDRNESILSDSLRDLRDEETIPIGTTPRGNHVSSPVRLSPVTEVLCSRSAPVNIDNVFSLSSNRASQQTRKALHVHIDELKDEQRNEELNSVLPSPVAQVQPRFCVTPIPTRYSRQSSCRDSESMMPNTIDDCIEMNLQELNSDKDAPSARDSASDGMRVRWNDNIEQINCGQDNVFGVQIVPRTGSFGASSTDTNRTSGLMNSNNHQAISRLIYQKDSSESQDECRAKLIEDLNDSRTSQTRVLTSIATTGDFISTPAVKVNHGSSDGSIEYEQPESHQCTVSSLTPLLLSDSTSTDEIETC